MYLLIDVLVIFLVNLLCLLPGLKKQKYYITTGYGLSVSCDAVCIFILCLIARPLNWLEYFKQGFIFHFLLLIIYGYRLAHFLYKRSFNSNYNAKVKEFKSVSWSISVAMMLSCAAIYLCMTSSLFVDGRSLTHGYSTNYVIKFVGIVIMICGLVVESVADSQKTFYKESNPDLFCSQGLYKYVRMPNYFGEITFWFGNFFTTFATKKALLLSILSMLGFLLTLLIIIPAARYLDKKQVEHYGKNPKYLEYRRTTPILFPFIPLYSFSCSPLSEQKSSKEE